MGALCLPLLWFRATSPNLLKDSDTAVLLQALRERNAPFSWFGSDWPLQNHFYRPVSTLFFELDQRLFGAQPAGYAWTNLLLVAGCVFALFWLLRELTDRVGVAVAGSAVFALWNTDLPQKHPWFHGVALATVLLALLPGRSLKSALVAASLGYLAADEWHHFQNLAASMLQWLPSRTASGMTLFGILGLAAFARSIRLGVERTKPAPSPLDPPATKGTLQQAAPDPKASRWLWAATAAFLLAFGCYEQAVMLPGLALAVFFAFRASGYKPKLTGPAVAFVVLLAYLAVRTAVLGTAVSGYQTQQYRHGVDVYISIADYLFPPVRPGHLVVSTWLGLESFLVPTTWHTLALTVSCLVATVVIWTGWRERRPAAILAALGWAASGIAFLPMAWLKHFDHYHFFPMAFRAVFVVGLFWLFGQQCVTAASRPPRQAPPRRDPAPGSLPRP